MSCTFLHRQKITVEKGFLTLLVAISDSNVMPQPGPGFGSRPHHFSPLGKVPVTSRKEIVELFEKISRAMDGGELRERREWITGARAWELWRIRLKKATGIDLGTPRLSKIYWFGLPPYLFGKFSPVDGLELIGCGELLDGKMIKALIDAKVEVPIKMSLEGRDYGGRIGFINKEGLLCAYKGKSHRSGFVLCGQVRAAQTFVLGVKTYGRVISSVAGVFAEESVHAERLIPTPKAERVFVLVNAGGACINKESQTTVGLCANPRVLVHDQPFCLDAEDAQEALERVRAFIPEEDWALERADLLVARLFP